MASAVARLDQLLPYWLQHMLNYRLIRTPRYGTFYGLGILHRVLNFIAWVLWFCVMQPTSSGPAFHFRAPTSARIYVIDDHSEVRKSLHMLFGTVGITSWPFGSAVDFLDQLDDLPSAPILLDIKMHDIDGVDVMKDLVARNNTWPVIIMTAHGNVPTAVNLMKLGAIDFIEKPFDLDVALNAVERAYQLLSITDASNASVIDARRRFSSLTQREAQVVGGILKGAANKILAANLQLSIRTVEMYRGYAFKKLKVRNMVSLVALAQLANWTSPVAEDI